MGCDIHAMIERKSEYIYWVNKGDPEIDRNYEIFSVLGNVRNGDSIPFISDARGVPHDCCGEYESWYESWSSDAHSASWVTLAEMKAYDLDREFFDSRLVLSRDEEGKITETCRETTGTHQGPVGKRRVFELWGRERWDNLIREMEKAKGDGQTDEDVRLVFFFDN